MWKFKTIGGYKNAVNRPEFTVAQDLKIGSCVFIDNVNNQLKTPASNADAVDWYFLGNIIDKPEIKDSKEHTILTGEFGRAFKGSSIVGLEVELSGDMIKDTYSTITTGDTLVPAVDGTGLWVKGTPSGIKEYLKITKLTTYGDQGIDAEVVRV